MGGWRAQRRQCVALIAGALVHCSPPTLSQTPPPVGSEAESVVLLWAYGNKKFGVAYDPDVSGPRGFALPDLKDGEAASVVALGYVDPVDAIGFSQAPVDLDKAQACLPRDPMETWGSTVRAQFAQPWSEDTWDTESVRDAFSLPDCPFANTCLEFPLARTISLPVGLLIEVLEPYRDGFLVADREGNFTYVDANEIAQPATEFAGSPSFASTRGPDGVMWLTGADGLVQRFNDGVAEDVSIETEETITGISISRDNQRVLALSLPRDGFRPPFTFKVHLLKNGRWLTVAELNDSSFSTVRFTAAWDSPETAYFTFAGTQLCRLIDESVLCNRDLERPGPVAYDDNLGVVMAAQDNRLLRSTGSGWAPIGGLPFLRKPTALLPIPGGILAGDDIGSVQQIRFDGGGDCPILSTVEQDADFIRRNDRKIAFVSSFNRNNRPTFVLLDMPDSN